MQKTRKTLYHRDINTIKGSLSKIAIRKRFNAGYGIRTRELLRDRILRPAPLADGEGKEHQERESIILLLDGILERRREGTACSHGELQEGRP